MIPGDQSIEIERNNPMNLKRIPVDMCLSAVAFEHAVTMIAEASGKSVPAVTLLVCPEEMFTAARIAKHCRELFDTHAYLKGNFIPPMIDHCVVNTAKRGWWAVIFENHMVWTPGCT